MWRELAQSGQLSNAAETMDLFTNIEENNPKKNGIKIVPRVGITKVIYTQGMYLCT